MTLMLVLLFIVNSADKVVLGIVAEPLREDLGLSASEFGLIGSAFFIAYTLGGLLAGQLNRWTGARTLLILLAVSWSIAMLPVVIWGTFFVLLASRIVLGVMEGPAAAIVHTALYSWHPVDKRGLPSAALSSTASITKVAVAPVLGLVAAAYSWHAAFLVLGLAGMFWAGAWLFAGREGPYIGQQHSAAEHPGADPAAGRVPWAKVFRSRTFLAASFTLFAMYMVNSAFLTWLPSYFESGLGFPRAQAAAMFALPGAFGIIALFALSATGDLLIRRGISSRIVRGIVPAVGALLCGVSLILPPVLADVSSSAWLPAVAVSIGYALGATIFPLFTAGLSELVPARQLPGTLGVLFAIMGLGGIVGPALIGLILDAAATEGAGYIQAFRVFGIVAVIAGALAILFFNPRCDRAAFERTTRAARTAG